MPQLTYASASARCQASSPSDRAPASGRKSYWPAGSARSNAAVFWASASHTPRNVCNSVVAIGTEPPLVLGSGRRVHREAATHARGKHRPWRGILQAREPRRFGSHPVAQPRRSTLDRKSTRLNSSHLVISYAVFCLKKKKIHLELKHVNATPSSLRSIAR